MLGTYPLSATPLSAIGLTVRLTAAAGAFALTGQNAAQQVRFAAGTGSYALTGQNAQPGQVFSLAANAGSFALTGQDAGFVVGRVVSGGAGAFTLSGQAAGARIRSAADTGAYALTGQSAAVGVRRTVGGGVGAFVLTGRDATLIRAKTVVGDTGTYVLSGQAVNFDRNNSQLGAHVVNTFTSPVNFRGELDANIIRTNDNLVVEAFNAHDTDAAIHTQSGSLSLRPASPVEGATWIATNTQDTFLYTGGQWVQVGWAHWYGDFYDTTDQAITTANTAQLVTLNSTGITRGTSLTSGSRVTVSYAGDYNIMFSVQFKNASADEQDAYLWLKKNGTNLADTAGRVTIPKKHGSEDGHSIAAWNVYATLAANDYVELYVQASSTDVTVETIAAAGSVPRSPSVILTINRI